MVANGLGKVADSQNEQDSAYQALTSIATVVLGCDLDNWTAQPLAMVANGLGKVADSQNEHSPGHGRQRSGQGGRQPE